MMGILNQDFINNVIGKCAFDISHAAADGYLGSGMLYYSLAYSLRATICVCIGSGGGFVPRLMRQAQLDASLPNSITHLIDADLPEAGWGRPNWLAPDSYFRTTWPDIVIHKMLSSQAASLFQPGEISYLHIDGDHSYKGALADCKAYLPLVSSYGLITMHDTDQRGIEGLGVPKVVEELKAAGHRVINLPFIGAGVAIIQKAA